MSVLSKSLLGAGVVAFGLALAGCGEVASESVAVPPAPAVDVAPVLTREVVHYEHFTGRLEAPERVEVRPRVSGYIDRVAFQEGRRVEAGQLLFTIDPQPFQVEVARQEAVLAGALATAQMAQQEYERARRLIDSRAISQEQLDLRRARSLEAAAAVDSARAALEQARLNLGYTRITAPIGGLASLAHVTRGNLVAAGDTVLTTVVATDRIYAYFEIDEQTFLAYRAMTRNTDTGVREREDLVRLNLVNETGYPHQGQLDFLDNHVDPDTGTLRARAVFDNGEGQFTPGLYARLALVLGAPTDAVLIDERAVGTDLSNKYVLVLNGDDTLAYRTVTLGDRIGRLRAVRSGLNGDETIVVNGLQRVRPGATVIPEMTQMADAATLRALAEEVEAVARAQAGGNAAVERLSQAGGQSPAGGRTVDADQG